MPFSEGTVLQLHGILYRYMPQPGGRAVGRFISIERIFEESKERYDETLETSAQGWHEAEHDIAPWLNEFWGALLRAYKEFEERVGTVNRGRGAKGARARAEILKRNLPFSISEIEEACHGISRDMVRVVLRTMEAHNATQRAARAGPDAFPKLDADERTQSDSRSSTTLKIVPCKAEMRSALKRFRQLGGRRRLAGTGTFITVVRAPRVDCRRRIAA